MSPEESNILGMNPSGVYRSGRGMIWRVTQSDEGDLTVEILEDGHWVRGRTGLVGLRLASSTTRLTGEEIRELPD